MKDILKHKILLVPYIIPAIAMKIEGIRISATFSSSFMMALFNSLDKGLQLRCHFNLDLDLDLDISLH